MCCGSIIINANGVTMYKKKRNHYKYIEKKSRKRAIITLLCCGFDGFLRRNTSPVCFFIGFLFQLLLKKLNLNECSRNRCARTCLYSLKFVAGGGELSRRNRISTRCPRLPVHGGGGWIVVDTVCLIRNLTYKSHRCDLNKRAHA